MLRTWTPSPSSSSLHIPGFTCEVRANLHVIEVFVQKYCFQSHYDTLTLFYIATTIFNTSPVLVFFCAYVFFLDIFVTEHLRGILRHAHRHSASVQTALEIICLHVHTL